MSKTASELPILEYATAAEFESWMDDHHSDADGVWVKVAKAGTEIDWVRFDDALHVALCFGWINGVRREVDREYYLQKFIPREPDSRWTWLECDKASWLLERGKMRPEGIAEIEAAKSDGRWDRAYEVRGEIKAPAELRARLASFPEARAFFESLDERNRNAIIHMMSGVNGHEARQLKLDQIIEMMHNKEAPYPS